MAAAGRLSDILAFDVRGWEVVVDGVKADAYTQISSMARRSTEIAPGRYALELPVTYAPEKLLAEFAATGARLVSINPIRDTLEDFFVRRVKEMGAGARAPEPGEAVRADR